MCSRGKYPENRDREEFGRPGVYVLVGPSQSDTGHQAIYIGRADVARECLDSDLRSKDFWTHLVLFASKDTDVNKAHVSYLEARLIEIAQRAKQADMMNGNDPPIMSLSETDRADAESFLEDMLLVYPVLGISAFENVEEPLEAPPPQNQARLVLRGIGTLAYGQETPEGFVVFSGSRGRRETVGSLFPRMVNLRRELLDTGVLVESPEGLILTQDYRFVSPSTAAGILMGRSANGRTEWKDETGRTLKTIQEAKLSTTQPTHKLD